MSDSSNPIDCSPPGSSVHGIFQAKVLEWGAIALSEWYFRRQEMGGWAEKRILYRFFTTAAYGMQQTKEKTFRLYTHGWKYSFLITQSFHRLCLKAMVLKFSKEHVQFQTAFHLFLKNHLYLCCELVKLQVISSINNY